MVYISAKYNIHNCIIKLLQIECKLAIPLPLGAFLTPQYVLRTTILVPTSVKVNLPDFSSTCYGHLQKPLLQYDKSSMG
jgi:hypothetical protein